MYYGNPAPPAVTPAIMFRVRAFMTLLWALPLFTLGFGLAGLPFGRGGRGALLGLVSAVLLATGRGYAGARAVRAHPELFQK